MNAGMTALLMENLKILKMAAIKRELKACLRQAKQEHLGYDEFLLNLTEAEVLSRKENGYKRRLSEAKFPLLKPLEVFDFDAAPAKPIWPPVWESKPVKTGSERVL